MTEPLTAEAILADVNANGFAAEIQDYLGKRLMEFHKEHEAELANVGLYAYSAVADFLEAHPEVDRDLALRACANQMIRGAVLFCKVLKRDRGEPFSAARFAMVAYELAHRSPNLEDAGAAEPV